MLDYKPCGVDLFSDFSPKCRQRDFQQSFGYFHLNVKNVLNVFQFHCQSDLSSASLGTLLSNLYLHHLHAGD